MYDKKYHNSDLKNFTFLVTGGAGFIGSHIVEYLLNHGAGNVRVLDNFATGFKKNLESFSTNKSFEFLEGDIRDLNTCQQACKDINIVFHQAALGSVPRSINDPVTTNAVNIDGFVNMLVASRDQKAKKFIYAASSSTYGDSKKLPKVEGEIGMPLSPYAVTKFVNELYARVFALNYGIKTIGLRYFNVFGPRQDPNGAYAAVIPLFINSLVNNKTVKIDGDGEQTRDFTFVENAVQANIRAAFAGNFNDLNEVYNVAVGERTSINQMFEIIKELSGSDVKPEYRQARAGDVRDSLADISKIKNHLGYNPTVNLKNGLKFTYEWFKNNREFINS
ncbi:MAG: SDR family oxidoreductase [Cytophagaceae bacterium]|nr:SDR family oxidoreductase [Cytophagaceae bacterium]